MSQITVIDASVAIKWFVEEKTQNTALAILEEIQNKPAQFAVPELFFNEMLGVLCRLSQDSRTIQSYMAALENLGFYRVGNGHELIGQAARIACHYRVSGYDAVYVATAHLLRGKWLTADKEAAKRVQSLKLARVL